ncbi:MAG: hypothetical protein KDD44_03220 [Bdellovibrionales bacterium]|nr:hypothetical protein [Bdellovibrionales bacterium]
MTIAGWIFMIGSLSFVIGLLTFCYWNVLRTPSSADHMHAPLDIDTGDVEEE